MSITLQETSNASSACNMSQSQPVALPRSVPSIRSAGPSPNLSRNNSFRKKEEPVTMKISTGTRQLRDHELTYFGVPKSTTPTPINTKINTSMKTSSNNISNISQQKVMSTPPTPLQMKREPLTSTPAVSSFAATFLIPSPATPNQKTNQNNQKWQLTSEKPDLIKYSQNCDQNPSKSSAVKSFKFNSVESEEKSKKEEDNDDPIYQNIHKISSPTKYNRKLDLERDEKILNELTRAADEIMNVSFFYNFYHF